MSIKTTDEIAFGQARLIVVMGATGCGKSTIGEKLSQRLNAAYIEGDDFHSALSKAKMAAGIALNDDDRWPWLETLSKTMRNNNGKHVVSCSALKRAYRDCITRNCNEPVLFVHLNGTKELLASRLSIRQGHFMNTDLLDSQLETLEPPQSDEFSFTVDINFSVQEIIEKIEHAILNQ